MTPVASRLLVAAALYGGCAETAFSTHARDNNVDDIKRAVALSHAPSPGPQNGTGHAMAFLVTSGGAAERRLVGYDLTANKIAWQADADVRSRVVVGRGVVAHRQGEHEIVGRDPRSGHVIMTVRLAADEKFVGMAADGERIYYVLQSMAGGKRTSYTVGVDAGGRELWRTAAPGSLGAPAARGGLVAVPFSYQNLSLLDGRSGQEVGRVRAIDEQISFVRALPDGFFYGGAKGIYLLDEKSAHGSKAGSSYVEAHLGSDQVRTFFYWDAYQTAQSDYSAFDRNRLLWRGQPRAGTAAFQDDLTVLHSYRYFFAFDAESGKIRWAYAHPRVDVVASEDTGAEVLFVTADGDLGALAARSGEVRVIAKTAIKVAGASFDAEGFAAGGEPAVRPELAQTLEQIIWDPDARFTAVKVFSTSALGGVAGLEATRALLKIVRAETGVPRAVQKRAGDALVERKDGTAGPLFVEALKAHYDYLADRHPQGVGAIARAAAAIGCKDAADELAAHLADHETPQSALKDVAAALGALGGKGALKALREFLLSYRADPMFLSDPGALTVAAEGLVRSGGPEERRTVSYVAEEARTLKPVAQYLRKVLTDGGARADAPAPPHQRGQGGQGVKGATGPEK
jgi:hypothetical protein